MESAGSAASNSVAATGLVQVAMGFLLQAGLGQLWSMLYSEQIVVYMPMFERLKVPASAMIITNALIKVATFDLIPTELIDDLLWYSQKERPIV